MQEIPNLIPYNSTLLFDSESKAKGAEDLLSWFKKEIDWQIKLFLKEKREEFADISEEAVDLVSEIDRFIFSGGRRVRPAFVYSGYVAAEGKAHDAILYAAMAVEFLHTFALIHDDIIDRSEVRRGKKTSHKAFEDLHKIKKMEGSPT